MPRSSKQLKVFLCHSSGDKSIVRELYKKLSAEGWIDPWLDKEKLLPGQNWDMEIEQALEATHAVIACLSNNSVTKEGYIQKELRSALFVQMTKPEGTIFIIPLRIDDCTPPRRFQEWQYVDYFPVSKRPAAYERLLASLKLRANDIQGISTVKPPYASSPETRYGTPAADQIVKNWHFTIGYSYHFRQAKWALEIVDPDKSDFERANSFQPDYRIPEMFRTDLADYEGSGFDRGYLVASGNQSEFELRNSETFLLSNISPRKPEINRGIWRELQDAVRTLDAQQQIRETFVICGPIFYFDVPIATIGSEDDNGVSLPIPHAYFKSVLTEDNKGKINMWSFIMPNKGLDKHKPLADFLVPTVKVEKYSGLLLWDRLTGRQIEKEKSKVRAMWKM